MPLVALVKKGQQQERVPGVLLGELRRVALRRVALRREALRREELRRQELKWLRQERLRVAGRELLQVGLMEQRAQRSERAQGLALQLVRGELVLRQVRGESVLRPLVLRLALRPQAHRKSVS